MQNALIGEFAQFFPFILAIPWAFSVDQISHPALQPRQRQRVPRVRGAAQQRLTRGLGGLQPSQAGVLPQQLTLPGLGPSTSISPWSCIPKTSEDFFLG